MLLERVFEVTLNINNPINFIANKHHNILTDLNNIYANKCYQGSYIIKINNIIQTSSCRIINSNSSASGIIDVKFSATVSMISRWDILIGVEIVKNQSLVVGLYKRNGMEISATIKPTHLHANTLTVGQLVPVRVIEAAHKPKTNQIAVAGVLLTCDTAANIYRVKGEIQKSFMPEIELLLNNIKEELKLRAELMLTKKNEVMFFESLLYSLKGTTKETEKIKIDKDHIYEGPVNNIEKTNVVNIFDIINKDMTGYWTRPLGLYRSSPLMQLSTEKPETYILTAPHILIIEYAKQILSFLICIREFVEIYKTPELIKSHENIWLMMRAKQI